MCKGEIDKHEYNHRVSKAVDYIHQYENSCLLVEKGRTKAEKSFIYLRKGRYAGYGFVEDSDDFNVDQFKDYLIPQQNSSYSDRIVNKYLSSKKNITRLDLNQAEEVEERETAEWFG